MILRDHVEVLYDLDVEAADACRAMDLPMVRASGVPLPIVADGQQETKESRRPTRPTGDEGGQEQIGSGRIRWKLRVRGRRAGASERPWVIALA